MTCGRGDYEFGISQNPKRNQMLPKKIGCGGTFFYKKWGREEVCVRRSILVPTFLTVTYSLIIVSFCRTIILDQVRIIDL